jgi:hypothetical protein
MDGQGNNSGCLVMSTPSTPRSFITVDGGLNTPCGWNVATNTSEGTCNGSIVNTQMGAGLAYDGGKTNAIALLNCTNCEVRNIGIYNMYQQTSGATTANIGYDSCMVFSGTNILIHDSDMHDVGWCMWYLGSNGDSNIQIYNNNVYNTPHPFYWTSNLTSGTMSGGYIYGNYLHDFENFDTSGCVYHIEGFHSSVNSGTTAFNDLYIYNNIINDSSACLYGALYLSATNSTGAFINNSSMFNNLIVTQNGTMNQSGIIDGGGNGNTAYNNTVINTIGPNSAGSGIHWSGISQNSYTFAFENNAVQGFDYLNGDDELNGTYNTGITADYNAYSGSPITGGPNGHVFGTFIPGANSNWSEYLTDAGSYGQEQHSINTGLYSNGDCCTGTLGLDSNYIAVSSSATVGKGVNLSSLCIQNGGSLPNALCSDLAGTARPATGAWDIGAYSWQGGSVGPYTTGAGPVSQGAARTW